MRLAIVVSGLGLVWAAAQRPQHAGLEGSKHDFTNEAWSGGDMCSACHTPHHENPPAAGPKWDPDADLTQRFGHSIVGDTTMDLGTMMCLRCHDGTIARDTVGGVEADRFAHARHPAFSMGAHAGTDHPVGVPYPNGDPDYHDAAMVRAGGDVKLPNDTVQCTSCHDPHNATGEPYMLVTTNERSHLCLICHKK